MAQTAAEIGLALDAMRESLAEAVVDRHYRLHADLEASYGERGRRKCLEDAAYHLSYLSQSLSACEPTLFREYVAWAKVMLAGRNIPARDLANNLEVISMVLKDRLSADDALVASGYVELALESLPEMSSVAPNCIVPNQPLTELAESYLASLLNCDRREAARLVLDSVQEGTSIKDVYIHVFQKSQHEIGRLWQTNQVTVAQEHYCTAATQMIMSQLYPRIFLEPRIGKCFVGACISGNLHEVGMRMVADFFEMEGWDTIFLGANMPISDTIRMLQDRKPDVVGISATITPHISAVAQLIATIRNAPNCGSIKILVGGHPFKIAPNLWKDVLADGTGLDAQSALASAKQLTGS